MFHMKKRVKFLVSLQMFSKEKEILSAFTQKTGINCVPLTSYSNKYCLGDIM